MSEILVLVKVTVNDAQLAKMNAKRKRFGNQERTPYDEVTNHIEESLQHNLMFDHPVEITDHSNMLARHNDVTTALKNVGIDTTCQACMSLAYTGRTAVEHTCSMWLVFRDPNPKPKCSCDRRTCTICYPYKP